MPVKWTNRSRPPSSGVMNPKPLSSLNHFTVPVAISHPSSVDPRAGFAPPRPGGKRTIPRPCAGKNTVGGHAPQQPPNVNDHRWGARPPTTSQRQDPSAGPRHGTGGSPNNPPTSNSGAQQLGGGRDLVHVAGRR